MHDITYTISQTNSLFSVQRYPELRQFCVDNDTIQTSARNRYPRETQTVCTHDPMPRSVNNSQGSIAENN